MARKLLQDEGMEVELLGVGCVLATKDDAKLHGTIYIEGRILDGIFCETTKQLQSDIEERLSSSMLTFENLRPDMLLDAADALGKLYKDTISFIQSLTVVEYVGPKVESTCFQLSEVRVIVQVYHMYGEGRALQDNKEVPQAEITSLPHLRFEDRWNDLVFDHDLKSDLIWMMYNILRFSAYSGNVITDMNPLILLHGPPGSGKTTLCQGLAQKISIRLGDRYTETRLVEIRTATLLSKFFSESAKKVEEIFSNICRMCEEDDEAFICVLIDEVESIASSRERVTKNGEVQDSLRATNALLTGLDRCKGYPNLMFLCTTNFLDALDSAFLDRCGMRQAVDPPSTSSQYAILCARIQGLIDRGVIQSEVRLPSFNDAAMDFGEAVLSPGSKLLQIIEQIGAINSKREFGSEISGRALTQLPEMAIMRHLREGDCDLEMALNFIEQSVLAGQSCRNSKAEVPHLGNRMAKTLEGVEVRGKKRKLTILLEEECDEDVLQEIIANLYGPKNAVKINEVGAT